MLDRDSEFLLWLAKRLVFKYGEDKQILDIVTAIVHKHESTTNIINSISKNIIAKANENIQISHQIIAELQNSYTELKNKINQTKNHIILSSFEDLDIDNILKK